MESKQPGQYVDDRAFSSRAGAMKKIKDLVFGALTLLVNLIIGKDEL